MMDKKSIIRLCLLYEFKLGSKASKASQKINFAFGEDAVKERMFQKFSSSDENLEDAPRSGRPVLLINDERCRIRFQSDMS